MPIFRSTPSLRQPLNHPIPPSLSPRISFSSYKYEDQWRTLFQLSLIIRRKKEMEVIKGTEKQSSYSWLACWNKCLPFSSSSSSRVPSRFRDGETSEKHGGVLSSAKEASRKPGGWKAMPFVLGLSLSLSPFSHLHGHAYLIARLILLIMCI